MKVIVVFEADPGVTSNEAYEAAEEMVTAAPLLTGERLTFLQIEVYG